MEQQELARRLMEIARGVPGVIIAERACWLDGEECPYGKPEGQFLKRPEAFCKPRIGGRVGCLKLNNNSDELENLLSETLRESIEKDVSEQISRATTEVSGELLALADQTTDNQKKEVLKLAAELIETGEDGLEDRKIVLLDDLEIE